MEMTGIDLTKCNNCLFRAVYNGRPVSGTVKVGEEWCNLNFDGGIVSVRVSGLPEDSGIADFEIVPRDPETYKDWQVGDVLFDSNCTNKNVVIFRSGEEGRGGHPEAPQVHERRAGAGEIQLWKGVEIGCLCRIEQYS